MNAYSNQDGISEFSVLPEESGVRIDKLLSIRYPSLSRTHFQKLIKAGMILCNGCEFSPNTEARTGSRISIHWSTRQAEVPKSENMPLKVLYEDEDVLVIDKPPGTAIHPGAGTRSGTIVNALLGKFADFAQKMDDLERPGIVHRLDKDTSGSVIIAKNPSSKFLLSRQFTERTIKKKYAAITYGHPARESQEIRTPIGRHPVNRKKMAVLKEGPREAISSFRTLRKGFIENQPVAFIEVEIKTGRTHQIRVHLAHLKIPVLGDKIYGGHQKLAAPRQMLHAWKIEFSQPRTGERICVESPLPSDIIEVLAKITG